MPLAWSRWSGCVARQTPVRRPPPSCRALELIPQTSSPRPSPDSDRQQYGGGPGGTNCLQILLDAQATKTRSVSASVTNEPADLCSANLGTTSAALLQSEPESTRAGQGRPGFGAVRDQTLAAGLQVMAEVCFPRRRRRRVGGDFRHHGDEPIVREVVDALANPLPTSYRNGDISITAGPSLRRSPFWPLANCG